MIYLCSVYSVNVDNMPEEFHITRMQKRYEYAAKRTAAFMKAGLTVFCPINHCHPIAVKHDMPRTWDFWEKHDINYIAASDKVYVLMMPHWKESKGITAELEFAEKIGKEIIYVECKDYKEETWQSNN